MRRVRAEVENALLSASGYDFESHAGTRFGHTLPGEADLACLLGQRHFRRAPDDNGCGTQVRGRTQNAIPQIIRGGHGEADGFPFLFGNGQDFGEKELLDGTEELFGIQVVFAGRSPTQQADMENNDVLLVSPQSLENRMQMIQGIVVADGNQYVARTDPDAGRRDIRLL